MNLFFSLMLLIINWLSLILAKPTKLSDFWTIL